jgi:hypothetical protein
VSAAYKNIKKQLDAVPAINTHDHLWPFDRRPPTFATNTSANSVMLSTSCLQ